MNNANLLGIKKEYTKYLINTLAPSIFEELKNNYKTVNNWDQNKINEETHRIKQNSDSVNYLDDLIKAIIKTNIRLLAHNDDNIVGQSFYDTLTPSFIHRCYLECAKSLCVCDNPLLICRDFDRFRSLIMKMIGRSIVSAIRKTVPIELVLRQYLVTKQVDNERLKIERRKRGRSTRKRRSNHRKESYKRIKNQTSDQDTLDDQVLGNDKCEIIIGMNNLRFDTH